MRARFLLGTYLCIDIARERPARVRERFEELAA
jgi:hypothetical protein